MAGEAWDGRILIPPARSDGHLSSTYFPLITILIYLVFTALSPAAYLFRRSLAHSWLTAVFGAIAGWVLILLTGFNLPVSMSLSAWKPAELFSSSPTLLVDGSSWPFALALAALALAVILTDVARELELELASWSGCLALTALGLLAVLAGNPLTLLMGWSALDISELLILLRFLRQSDERRQAVNVFAARAGGIFMLLYGLTRATAEGVPLQFDQMPVDVSIYFLLATSLRLGVVPLHMTFWREPPLRRGIGTISRMATVAASLAFLPRVAAIGVPEGQWAILLALASLFALYAGFSWISAANELEGRTYWILGMAALSLAAAIRGQPLPSLVWGVTLVFTGGLLFLYSARNRYLSLIPILGALSSAALPFTPTWLGGQFYGPPFSLWHLVFLISHALLLGGIIRHSLRPGESLSQVERWVWVIYPAGLLLMLASYFLSGWVGGTLLGNEIWAIKLTTIIPGVIVLGLVALVLSLESRGAHLPLQLQSTFRSMFSLNWFYAFLGWLFRMVERGIAFITTILEGEGGILWALLLLALLMAFLSQLELAGG
jgi:hypothetical protein